MHVEGIVSQVLFSEIQIKVKVSPALEQQCIYVQLGMLRGLVVTYLKWLVIQLF